MTSRTLTLKEASDRVSDGHTVLCNIYPDFQGTCDCGYERAIVEMLDTVEPVLACIKALEDVVEAAQKMHDWLCDLEKMGYPKGHAPICTALGLAAALSRLQATEGE